MKDTTFIYNTKKERRKRRKKKKKNQTFLTKLFNAFEHLNMY